MQFIILINVIYKSKILKVAVDLLPKKCIINKLYSLYVKLALFRGHVLIWYIVSVLEFLIETGSTNLDHLISKVSMYSIFIYVQIFSKTIQYKVNRKCCQGHEQCNLACSFCFIVLSRYRCDAIFSSLVNENKKQNLIY